MPKPISDSRLLKRIQNSEIGALRSLLGDQAVRTFGDLSVVHSPDDPIERRPRIFGLSKKTIESLDEALGSLGPAAKSARVAVLPGVLDASIADALFQRGFRQTAFVSMMYGSPGDSEIQPNPGVDIIPAISDAAFKDFVRIYQEGWDVPEEEQKGPDELAHWREAGELFLASLHGTPVSAAILFPTEKVAYLGRTSTTHVLRRQGGHLALIQHRLARAVEDGFDAVCAQAPFDSPAQRNLVRGGLWIAATKASWTRN